MQKKTLFVAERNSISIDHWLVGLLALGRYGFSTDLLKQELSCYSDVAVKRALSRLISQGKILSLQRGYYLIIPPQYTSKGILPPTLYLDAWMKYLQRPYYVALLNAAACHGAAHQQPQEYFVVVGFPVMRPIQKKRQKVNFISIKEIPDALLAKRKTDAGYLKISNAALTACDLIQYEKRVGGLNRVATVLGELVDTVSHTDFTRALLQHVHCTTLQRLGYLLEFVCFNQSLADALFEVMHSHELRLFRISLKASKETKRYSLANRWQVIVNTEIEIDE